MKQISNQSVSYDYDALSNDALNHLNSLKFSETKTRRICLHQNTEAELHMMVVDLQNPILNINYTAIRNPMKSSYYYQVK